jgi:hypothetical protein
MMQLARRASLGVVLLLLASVGTASAECAWVLWWEVAGRGPVIMTARDERRECAKDRIAAYTRDGRAAVPATGAFVELGSAKVLARYVCLPDTVDLRGPKAK